MFYSPGYLICRSTTGAQRLCPQATAFAFSALFCPSANTAARGIWTQVQTWEGSWAEQNHFGLLQSPQFFLPCSSLLWSCIASWFPRWILRRPEYSTSAELICFLEVIWLNFIEPWSVYFIIILIAEYYFQIILVVIDISWSGIKNICTMTLHAIYFMFSNTIILSRHHLL